MALLPSDVLDWVRRHPLPSGRIIPVCLWGEKGVGKTAWVRAYAAERNFGLHDFHPAHDNDGRDIVGLAYRDEQMNRTMHARPLWLPQQDDPVEWKVEGVMLFDELNRANASVLAGLLEPLGEGTIEKSGWRQPHGWQFICCCNPNGPGYEVRALDEPMVNRLLHLPMAFDAASWARWAQRAELHPDVVGFTASRPEVIAGGLSELPADLDIYATPRSLEYLGRLYEPEMDRELLTVLGHGLVGPEATAQFLAYLDGPQRALSVEQLLAPEGGPALAALAAAGQEALVEGSMVLLAAWLAARPVDNSLVEALRAMARSWPEGAAAALLRDCRRVAPAWEQALRQR